MTHTYRVHGNTIRTTHICQGNKNDRKNYTRPNLGYVEKVATIFSMRLYANIDFAQSQRRFREIGMIKWKCFESKGYSIFFVDLLS